MTSVFKWTPQREKAAIALANGHTQKQAAEVASVTDRTIRTWLTEPEFEQEVDRLSHMVGVATRAARLRLVNRVVTELIKSERLTERDLLDWLKYAQSETDGAKLDMASLYDSING